MLYGAAKQHERNLHIGYVDENRSTLSKMGVLMRIDVWQDALVAYQKNFLWSGGSEDGGVIANVERELSIRATMLHDTPHSTFSR